MALTKLGKYIKQCELKNTDDKYGENCVVGISTQKMMISTKADLYDVKLTSYKLLPPKHFAYVPDTSRRGDKMSLCYNDTEKTYIVSSISIVFYVNNTKELNPEYLFMYFNRPEFDRYSRFNSWGSARETFDWSDMCDIDIELPSIEIQQKYVDIYNAMLANQKSYERGLEDLKLVCDAYIEDLRRKNSTEKIGKYLQAIDLKNLNLKYSLENVKGISIEKRFIETKANMDNVPLHNYKIVEKDCFAFNPNTARMGEKLSIALNLDNTILVSSIYPVFSVNSSILLPKYLFIWFKRSEFDRYVRFNSWGSAREIYNYNDICEFQIPIPDIKIQQCIVDIFSSYQKRHEINERLKAQIKNICPILIKGSLEEGKRSNG